MCLKTQFTKEQEKKTIKSNQYFFLLFYSIKMRENESKFDIVVAFFNIMLNIIQYKFIYLFIILYILYYKCIY